MDLIITLASLLFLVFYSGYLFRGRHESRFSALLVVSFLCSLVFSWGLFLLANIFDPPKSVLLAIMLIASILVLFMQRAKSRIPATESYGNSFTKTELGLVGFISLLAALVLFGGYLYISRFYSPVFWFWDAVASYNRWAIDLALGQYESSGGAAYPLLFPGLWSLLYRIQGDVDFWILTKATTVVAPVIFWLYALALSIERRSLFPVLFLVMCSGLVVFRTNQFLQGTMDLPVVIFGAITCLMLWSESTSPPDKSANTSIFCAAVTMLVKQAGLIFFMLVTMVKIIEARSILGFVRANARLLIVAVTLALSFATFFLYYNEWTIVHRSLGGLRRVAENASGETGLHAHGIGLAKQYMPWLITIPLGACCALGFVLATRRLKIVSILSLVLGVIGFFAWLNFASYNIRNLYWVIILFAFSGCIGLNAVLEKCGAMIVRRFSLKDVSDKPYQLKFPVSTAHIRRLVLLIPPAIATAVALTGMEQLQQINRTARDESIPAGLRSVFTEQRLNQKPNFSVLTNLQPLTWTPKLKGHISYNNMRGGGYQLLRARVVAKQDEILLLRKLPVGGRYEQVRRLQADGLITLVQENELYAIFRIQ